MTRLRMANSLTPFLYHTRTLSHLVRAGPAVRRWVSSTHHHHKTNGTHIGTPAPTLATPHPEHWPSAHGSHEDVPFELPYDLERLDENLANPDPGARDLLSPTERQIFVDIFADIARSKMPSLVVANRTPTRQPSAVTKNAAPGGNGPPQFLAGLLDPGRSSSDPPPTEDNPLTATATINSSSITQNAARSTTTDPAIVGADPLSPLVANYSAPERDQAMMMFPPTLRKAARETVGMFAPFEAEGGVSAAGSAPKDAERPEDVHAGHAGRSREKLAKTVKIEARRRKERIRIHKQMMACTNDFAVWFTMEKHVFALVRRLGINQLPADTVVQPFKAKTSKGKPRKGRGTMVVQADAANAAADASAKAAAAATATKPRPFPKAELDMEIYGPMYPQLLLDGLNILGNQFSRPSPYMHLILPRIKELGLVSYVLGVSTAFYNRLMLLLWTRLGDATGVFELLEEMRHAGIPFDVDSLSVVSRIETVYGQAYHGERGRFLRELMSAPEYEPVLVQSLKHWLGYIRANMRPRDI